MHRAPLGPDPKLSSFKLCRRCSLQERDGQLSSLHDELKQLREKQEVAVSILNTLHIRRDAFVESPVTNGK